MRRIYGLVVLTWTIISIPSTNSGNVTLPNKVPILPFNPPNYSPTNEAQQSVECFYFCPSWSTITILTIIFLLMCCFCAAMSHQQPREIWYVVDPNARPGQPTEPARTLPVQGSWIRIAFWRIRFKFRVMVKSERILEMCKKRAAIWTKIKISIQFRRRVRYFIFSRDQPRNRKIFVNSELQSFATVTIWAGRTKIYL